MKLWITATLLTSAVFPAMANDDMAHLDTVPVINGCKLEAETACPGADLGAADLSNLNLRGADLRGSNLTGATLNHTNLRGANLNGAKLDNATGYRLQLYRASLRGAKVRNATLPGLQGESLFAQEADFTGTDISGAYFAFSRFSGATLADTRAPFSSFEIAWLPKANLEGADLTGADLQEAKFGHANLAKARLSGARIHFATFEGTFMEDCTDCPFDW